MDSNYVVLVVDYEGIKGEVYRFDTFKEANKYAKARKELIDILYPKGSLKSFFRPRVIVSALNDLRKVKRQNRSNEINSKITGDIQKRMKRSYEHHQSNLSKRSQKIINCYEKTNLAHSLYDCLLEDDSNLREAVQTLADSILNEDIMPTLCDIGYVF